MLTDGNCLNSRISEVLEKLYTGLLSLASYIAWQMGVSVETAEDALQDALVLVLQRADAAWLAEFLAASPKKQIGYFLTAMHNNALKAILRNRLDPLPETPCEDETSPDPAEEVERADTRRAVWEAIQHLPKRQREVIQLGDIEDWSREDITKHLKISAVNLRQQRFKGLQQMKKLLQSQDITP
jgi:RNA polymerase sigma factor (sigma-70 family)